MVRESLTDLLAFVAVARERSFTRAAAQLGVSPSALSHRMRALEQRLKLRLLTRTTRSVSTTEVGERLLQSLGPKFADIDTELESLVSQRERPAGHLRITATDHSVRTVLWPALKKFLPRYPDIHIEVLADAELRDIAADRFDAGVRLGEQVAKDMIAVPIGPPLRMSVVAAPEIWRQWGRPESPHELANYPCINLRLPTYGGLYVWEFERRGRALNVRVTGQLIFNRSEQILQAALDKMGVAFLPEDMVLPHLKSRQLHRVLDDWCEPFAGYHLYYPSRRQQSTALALLVDALRYRG